MRLSCLAWPIFGSTALRRLPRGTGVFAVKLTERGVERIPVDLSSQRQQRAGGVEQLIEVGLEQQQVVLIGRLRLHPRTPNRKVLIVGTNLPCNLRAGIRSGSP